MTLFIFVLFTACVAVYVWVRLRKEKLDSNDGYFLAGRSLSGVVIAGSMLLTNISTEHLVGMNGSAYRNGLIIISWEITSALALVATALYFVPRYLRMGLTTIPQYLEYRYDHRTRTLVAVFLMISFVVTLLPIVLYTGAINLESIFKVSEVTGLSNDQAIWLTVVVVGIIGAIYAIFGGLKAVALSDTINGYGLLIGGLLVPVLALLDIGDGNLVEGIRRLVDNAPEKFNVIGSRDSVLPFETLFTGLVINQIYFWCMNQTIIQRALGAKNLVEAQKGLLYTGVLKLLVPVIIILPGVIGFYYYGDTYYDTQDAVYPVLVSRVLPEWLTGFFAAVVMGAVLSTFNSVLNSAATIFSLGIYKKELRPKASEREQVVAGKLVSAVMAVGAICIAPLVAKAPEGLYQLLQQLNGIFFIPIGSIMIAGFFLPRVSAVAARTSLIVGLTFYLTFSFVLDSGIHFIHIWGIEFLLNIATMLIVSRYFPVKEVFVMPNANAVDQTSWPLAKPFGAAIVVATLSIYFWLGPIFG